MDSESYLSMTPNYTYDLDSIAHSTCTTTTDVRYNMYSASRVHAYHQNKTSYPD